MAASGGNEAANTSSVKPDVKILIDNKRMKTKNDIIMIDDKAYIPLREVCEALGAKVIWNASSKTAYVTKKPDAQQLSAAAASQPNYMPLAMTTLAVPASASSNQMKVNGKLINDVTMIDCDTIKDMFGLDVRFDKNMNVVAISNGKSTLNADELLSMLPSFDGYSTDDYIWLSKIIEAEAGGEDYASKLAVGNVIINRLNCDMYPDTIKEVIFDRKHGVQFTPIVNGAINNTPSIESCLAAIDALEGKNIAQNTLFFINPRLARSTWVQSNRKYAFSVGSHSFYY